MIETEGRPDLKMLPMKRKKKRGKEEKEGRRERKIKRITAEPHYIIP